MRLKRSHVEALSESFRDDRELQEVELISGVDGRVTAKRVVVQEVLKPLSLSKPPRKEGPA